MGCALADARPPRSRCCAGPRWPARRFGLLGRMAARGIDGRALAHRVAIAALMIAVSATIGVGVMIASFREAVDELARGHAARGRVHLRRRASSAAAPTPRSIRAAGRAARRHARRRALQHVARRRRARVRAGPVQVVALDVDPAGPRRWRFLKEGSAERVWPRWSDGAVIVSEPYAYRHGTARRRRRCGCATDHGARAFRVAGVFYDYGSSAGRGGDEPRDLRAPLGRPRGLGPRARRRAGRRRRRAGGGRAASAPARARRAVVVRSNRALREASLEIFDRTFAITRRAAARSAWRGLRRRAGRAHGAAAGARARDRRAARLGLTPRQVWGLDHRADGAHGAAGGRCSRVPMGVLLAAVLVFVINQRSFGWTHAARGVARRCCSRRWCWRCWPRCWPASTRAWRMARALPAEALRDE